MNALYASPSVNGLVETLASDQAVGNQTRALLKVEETPVAPDLKADDVGALLDALAAQAIERGALSELLVQLLCPLDMTIRDLVGAFGEDLL